MALRRTLAIKVYIYAAESKKSLSNRKSHLFKGPPFLSQLGGRQRVPLGAQSHLLKPHSLLTAVVPPLSCITTGDSPATTVVDLCCRGVLSLGSLILASPRELASPSLIACATNARRGQCQDVIDAHSNHSKGH